MKVVLDEALKDVERIRTRITLDSPATADSVVRRIMKSTERLGWFPRLDHEGDEPRTQEWVVVGLPYVIVYEFSTERDELLVLGVSHGAQEHRR
jgi:plasmid stabilization system protein ParE